MTAVKRSLDEISQPPPSELTKTERRRLAKQAKKRRIKESKIGGRGPPSKDEGGKGGKGGGNSANDRGTLEEGKKGSKPKMTKEERRAKYTEKAYQMRERRSQAGPGAAKTRCLGCRAWGHMVANCPNAKVHTGICFNCGSSEHALRVCTKPKQEDGSLPHAKCFVCKEKGHISAHCKQNANGIYPKGGSCKGCGSRHHFFKNCPDNPKASVEKNKNEDADGAESDEDNEDRADTSLAPAASRAAASAPRAQKDQPKRRLPADAVGASARVQGGPNMSAAARTGGDDLEDDDYFESEDVPSLFAEGLEEDTAWQQHSKKTKTKAKIVVF